MFLRECLSSILSGGVQDQFEVVVSDNASTDHTLDVLEEFRNRLPLRWVIQDSNIGADRNFNAVISLAQGEYCWLLGSDDFVVQGAVRTLLANIMMYRTDILHFGYIQGDVRLRPLYHVTHPAGRIDPSPEALASYFGAQPNLSLLFTFISSFAFRRSVWMDRQVSLQGWIGSFYVHMFAMHSALVSGATLAAIADCLVVARGNNPNEFNTVPGRFIALDARTVARVMREIYGNRPGMWLAISRPFHGSYPARTLIYVAANGGIGYLKESREALLRLGYSQGLLDGLALLERLNLLNAVKCMLDMRRKVLKKLNA